jgi:hypothetical protein
MRKVLGIAAAGLVSLFAMAAVDAANAGELERMVAACEANAACAHHRLEADGGVLFVLHGTMSIRYVACRNDGSCIWKLPKGKSIALTQPPRVLASR